MTSHHELPNFMLTPQQQSLLFEALNSHKPAVASTGSVQTAPLSSFDGSPLDPSLSSFQESPLFNEYDYDFGGADSSFDVSLGLGDSGDKLKMIGDLPNAPSITKSESTEVESPDKRSHPDDADEEEENGAKRRESEDKVAKKPGRKPLTTEPSSKRKAQNRAAQRAFRERKEKHLRDLEAKVQELEKASQTANHENQLLRAKIERMTVELGEYKKKLSVAATPRSSPHGPPRPFGQSFVNNINDVSFQFEFPKFGSLPGPSSAVNNANRQSPGTSTSSPTASSHVPSRQGSNHVSPREQSKDGESTVSRSGSSSRSNPNMQTGGHAASLPSGVFNPPLTSSNMANVSPNSLDSHYSSGAAASTSSPSASSNSNTGGPNSSCRTSPEPFTQSPPGFKPTDVLTTIGEEHVSLSNTDEGLGHLVQPGPNDINWLPSDFRFEPQLFNDYRDPQESLFLNTDFDDGLFDGLDVDFTTPYNLPMANVTAKKPDLISQIEAAKNDDVLDSSGQLLSCNKIWEKLHRCPKVQSGDFDLDGLCSDLQKKAKCNGTGPVVDEKDFQMVMNKYLCKDEVKNEQSSKTLGQGANKIPQEA
ncbi:hypothetical protein VTK73DRAFT_2238 [Phialemonium thermophilum]|uniref:BZIP domain-containing protein n=1 Tax=Phialemonium thermophilum TaxID=223376 RepID=A0ABR3X5I6_9PEZI